MLALNSYGLRGNNNAERVTLPRLCGSSLPAVREIRSLSKLDLLARSAGHPLYRTTAGYDYGRYLDFQDVALSCPKHARPVAFTKEFIAGTYADSSLLSLENNKRRAEHWQQKMALRSSQMRVKYAELQHVLEEKKELRRVERDKRRREMHILRAAVVQLQARMRGYLMRRSLAQEKLQRDTDAALCIQQACRARGRVRAAKQVLEARRRQKQQVFAIKIQRICRNFILRRRAQRQLTKLREAKRQKAIDLEQEALRPNLTSKYVTIDERSECTQPDPSTNWATLTPTTTSIKCLSDAPGSSLYTTASGYAAKRRANARVNDTSSFVWRAASLQKRPFRSQAKPFAMDRIVDLVEHLQPYAELATPLDFSFLHAQVEQLSVTLGLGSDQLCYVLCHRASAAKQIQRLARGHLARKDLHRQASSASSMTSEKDDKDSLLSINGRIRSRGARRVIAQMQQVRRKHTKAAVRIAGPPPK